MTTVLFACVHNAGRSQMSAAFFNAFADPSKATAISAGTDPAGKVHVEVLQAMQELGFDLSRAIPRRLTDELSRQVQVLVTMGCGETCPVVPGLIREDWQIADPKGKPAAIVREIRDDLARRVRLFVRENGWDNNSVS